MPLSLKNRIMKHLRLATIAVAAALCSTVTAQQFKDRSFGFTPFDDARMRAFVDSVYKQMSWEERLAQLHGVTPGRLADADGRLSTEKCREIIPNGIGHLCQFGCGLKNEPNKLRDFVADLQKWLKENTRCHIPAICHEEAIEGVAANGATVYPQQIGMGCSWDCLIMEEKARRTQRDMKRLGAQMALSPMLDVVRTSNFNRLEEGFGEDGYLSGAMGLAFVRGLQGKNMRDGIATCSKHFLGYGGGAESPDKELTEEILFPHEAVIRMGDSKCVMTGYHKYKGKYVVANDDIINDILRTRTGFDGITVSDYGSIIAVCKEGNKEEQFLKSGAMAMSAGNDLEFSNGKCYPLLKKAIDEGLTTEARVEEAVKRSLTLKVRMGLFDQSTPLYADGDIALDDAESRQLAYRTAAETVVMLKNNGVLPLKKGAKVTLVGPNANSFWSMLGDYAYPAIMSFWHGIEQDGLNPKIVTLLEGLKNKAAAGTTIEYSRGCEWAKPGEASITKSGDVDPRTSRLENMLLKSADPTDWNDAIAVASRSDIIVAAMGESPALCGESRVRDNIKLPGDQEKFVKELIATGKPVVLLLFGGRPLVIDDIAGGCAAILHAWYPGEEGGNAVADILIGNVSPSGKLDISYPKVQTDKAVCYNYGSGQESLIEWPFGYGLSYSTFNYTDLKVKNTELCTDDNCVELSFKVKNTGKRDAAEVAQVYVSPTEGNNLKPIQLKAFCRLPLAKGEERTVSVKIFLDQLAFYKDREWKTAPGTYRIKVGASSNDIRLSQDVNVKGTETSKRFRRELFADVNVE